MLIAALVAILVAVAIILSSHSASAQFYELPKGQIAPALEARIDRETHGRLLTVHFYSRALKRDAGYLIYLPAGYRSDRPLAAFYLLLSVKLRKRCAVGARSALSLTASG